MRKVYLIAGHNGPGTGATGHIDEGAETIVLRDLITAELAAIGITAINDPNRDKLSKVVSWLKGVIRRQDIMIEIHFNASTNPKANGVECLISKEGELERQLAEDLCFFTSIHSKLRSRGVKAENAGAHSRLAMLSDFACEQVIWEVCFVSNKEDADTYFANRNRLAHAIALALYYHVTGKHYAP